ncbi:MAG: hypothetical protein QOK27_16 [Gemmatimonadales bacterium]|nr:hypothetical protein [Gemmatimonadales bacterium]
MRLPPAPLVWIYTAAGVVLIAATLTCGGGESLTAPTAGTLEVTTSTSGVEPDPDGYMMQMDAEPPQPIAPTGTLRSSNVAPGNHTVGLSGIAGNCTVGGQNPRTVAVDAGRITTVALEVTCQATSGTLHITSTTTGASPDADGYTILLDGSDQGALGTSSQVTLSGIAPGNHLVGLTGVSANCHVEGDNPLAVTVSAGGSGSIAYTVTCSTPPPNPGSLQITTSTGGSDRDADGYTVTLDGVSLGPIGVSSTTTIANLAANTHSVGLADVATNCAVQGTNPRPIAITGGATAAVTFTISCAATSGSIKVSASTTGVDLDGNGYTLTLDGANSQHLDATGSLTLGQVPPGSHTVALGDVALNCTPANGASRTLTVTVGATAEASFAVTCVQGTQAPATLELVSGNSQSAGAGQKLGNPLVVRVLDAANAPMVGVTVTWAVTGGGGSVSPISGPTGAQGTASAEWTVGTSPGPQTLTASVAALTPVTFTATATASVEAEMGQWTPPFDWGAPSALVVGVHLHLLPTGRVLTYGLMGSPEVWDPVSNSFTLSTSATRLVCSGHAFLPDGRLFVSGGHIAAKKGLPDANIFDPASQTFTPVQPMAQGRWYPTTTTLANGEMLTIGGSDSSMVMVPIPEVWTGSGWRRLTGASLALPYYPWTFQAPNGKVFYAGWSKVSRYLDAQGTGAWSMVGNSIYGDREAGTAVMYQPGKVLIVGGGGGRFAPGALPTSTAETIDLTSGSPQWRSTGSMAFARRHLNATVLPTGDVLVVGGTNAAGFNNAAGTVHAAEIWNPSAGTWKTLASNTINRIYHSTAILLPDARVLVAGAGENFDADTRTQDVNQFNAEIYSPPYLFRGPRPAIGSAPAAISYGSSFAVATADAGSISKVSLVRLSSVTHSFNQNQRFMSLTFQPQTGSLSVAAPANSNLAPPGDYLLFLVNAAGVPSTGRFVNIR